ncbi:MAG: adenylate/guanylate cyclase domain-containing protein [Candidatus Nanopelagicales bacterium]
MTDTTPRPEDVVDALVEKVLGDPRSLRREEVAEQSGVPLAEARRLWRAMGFADVGDAVAFTAGDLEALRALDSLVVRDLLDRDDAVEVTRALGLTTSRLADWQADTFGRLLVESGALDRDDPLGPASAEGLGRELDQLLPVLEKLLVHVWRRQLAAALERGLADAEADGEVETGHLTVGFADQVGFTRLSRRLEENELAQLVERFESRSADIVVASGGRVIKTLGDEILFVSADPAAAAEAALRLIAEHEADEEMPRLRIGLATGVVVTRRGDVFGTTVNLANRLTAVARPDTVLVDAVTAEVLHDEEAFTLRPVPPRAVRGIGLVRPVLLGRAPGG